MAGGKTGYKLDRSRGLLGFSSREKCCINDMNCIGERENGPGGGLVGISHSDRVSA